MTPQSKSKAKRGAVAGGVATTLATALYLFLQLHAGESELPLPDTRIDDLDKRVARVEHRLDSISEQKNGEKVERLSKEIYELRGAVLTFLRLRGGE